MPCCSFALSGTIARSRRGTSVQSSPALSPLEATVLAALEPDAMTNRARRTPGLVIPGAASRPLAHSRAIAPHYRPAPHARLHACARGSDSTGASPTSLLPADAREDAHRGSTLSGAIVRREWPPRHVAPRKNPCAPTRSPSRTRRVGEAGPHVRAAHYRPLGKPFVERP